jgi:hypothetical protein
MPPFLTTAGNRKKGSGEKKKSETIPLSLTVDMLLNFEL